MKSMRVQAVWLLLAVVVDMIHRPRLSVSAQAQSNPSRMVWISASNTTALCNDFTRAGFFIRQNPSSKNWVVFLESGGLCYSTESCNRRFFVREVSYA